MFALLTGSAFAGDGGTVDKADTLWVIISTTFVLFMLPGLAVFYTGMVSAKNVLSTMLYSFVSIFVVGLLWFMFGHSLAFSDGGAFIGGTGFMFFKGVMTAMHGTIPESVFAMFQAMFAIVTCALLSGSIVERVKFNAFVIFIAVWCLAVYAPVAHWVWGGGFLAKLGVLDFAGGIVVHFTSAVAALVFIFMLGSRTGFPKTQFLPHNLSLTVLGTGLLWFGWFGFNAGSALAVNNVAYLAFVNTFVAGCAGGLSWSLMEYRHGTPTALGISSGIVAGLASVTNAAGFVTPPFAVLIGLVGGAICYMAVFIKFKVKYDDSLDVIGIHGVGGIWGALATGLFVSVGGQGAVFGNVRQLLVQLGSLCAVLIYTVVVTFIILKVIDLAIGLRVTPEDETVGLDRAQHGETAYN